MNYWKNNTVYYTFAAGFTLKDNVLAAIREWTNKTILTFLEGTGSGDYIEFRNADYNASNSIGKLGGKQIIWLSPTGSNIGTAIHEIGHAVGLIHEQCRNDRDNYINIHWNNILPGKISQFNIYPLGTTTDIGNFDFNSVMLYSSNAFPINPAEPTMTTKDGLFFIGQRLYLSAGDVEGVQAMYGPPYLKLDKEITVIEERIDGIHEYTELEVNYFITFYKDKACTQPTILKYPRHVAYEITRSECHSYGDPIQTYKTINDVTIPGNVTSYHLGAVRIIEAYTMSNPEHIEITDYRLLN
ncbi:MAG: M12 family metallopeptidase [Prevotella sp.]|nr:M12 family metallopeptidase [Prevotella sp.]